MKIGLPVRLHMECHIDMCTTGHRHPYKVNYKVGFTGEGRFVAVDVRMWNNAGFSLDQSLQVMQTRMVAMCNTY